MSRYCIVGISQFSAVTQSCPTLCDPRDCSLPSFPVNHQLPELAQTHVHWVNDATQLSHPLSSPSPPAFHFSQHQSLFKWVRYLHQVAKVLELQIQHHPCNEHSELISFRTDWFDLLAVQETLNTIVQKHQFFSAQRSLWSISHICTWLLEKPYLWLCRTLLEKWLSLLFNMLFRFFIAFLPRSKCLLISWLQSTSTVTLETKKIKAVIMSTFSPIYFPWGDGTGS